jgi:hypothetical protein
MSSTPPPDSESSFLYTHIEPYKSEKFLKNLSGVESVKILFKAVSTGRLVFSGLFPILRQDTD